MERWNKLENMSTLSIKHTVPEDNSDCKSNGMVWMFEHPYTPIYSVTKSHGTPIIKGSIRRDSLNRKGFIGTTKFLIVFI